MYPIANDLRWWPHDLALIITIMIITLSLIMSNIDIKQ